MCPCLGVVSGGGLYISFLCAVPLSKGQVTKDVQ